MPDPYPELERKLRPLADPPPEPRPGDRLAEHDEPGQTFAEYRDSRPVRRGDGLSTIYLCSVGDFPGLVGTHRSRRALDHVLAAAGSSTVPVHGLYLPPVPPEVFRRRVEIVNAHGLHMRPADKFVRLANSFRSEVRVGHRGAWVNGKSILDMTTLAAGCGTTLGLEARGPDAEQALAALADLVAAGFHMTDEDYC